MELVIGFNIGLLIFNSIYLINTGNPIFAILIAINTTVISIGVTNANS